MGMEQTSNFRGDRSDRSAVPVERRSILLRGYVESAPPKREGRWWRQPPSRFTLFWDTETTDDAAQRLRFGCYQLWDGEQPRERGIFYDADAVKPSELDALRRTAAMRGYQLSCTAQFVDRILYPVAKAGGIIVGFNLPFDISRIAIAHDTARVVSQQKGRKKERIVDRSMQGGFTFKLSDDPKNGRLRVKHLSRRMAFINFSAAERGYFLDLRTLAAALTSQSHSLDSLARALKTDIPKSELR